MESRKHNSQFLLEVSTSRKYDYVMVLVYHSNKIPENSEDIITHYLLSVQ
jgi:hypothetical protein